MGFPITPSLHYSNAFPMNPQLRKLLASSILCVCLSAGAALRASDWPQWRGPNRDGRVADGAPVPASIAPEPKRVWQLQIGGGFSSPVVSGNHLVYQDGLDGKEVAHLIDAGTGKEIWR